MPRQTVVNPFGALRKVSDFTTFKSDDGDVLYPVSTEACIVRCNATTAKGEVVNWVIPTTTLPISVTPMAAATRGTLFAGIANHAAAAGDDLEITTAGVCLVDVAAETSAFGSLLTKPATTTGKGEIGTTEDATMVAGTVLGITLTAKNASNLALAIIKHM